MVHAGDSNGVAQLQSQSGRQSCRGLQGEPAQHSQRRGVGAQMRGPSCKGAKPAAHACAISASLSPPSGAVERGHDLGAGQSRKTWRCRRAQHGAASPAASGGSAPAIGPGSAPARSLATRLRPHLLGSRRDGHATPVLAFLVGPLADEAQHRAFAHQGLDGRRPSSVAFSITPSMRSLAGITTASRTVCVSSRCAGLGRPARPRRFAGPWP